MADLKLTVPRPVKKYHRSTYDRIALQNTGFVAKGKTVLLRASASPRPKHSQKQASNVWFLSLARRIQRAKDELTTSFPNTETLTYAAWVIDHASMAKIFDELKDIDILLLSAFQTHGQSLPQDVDTSRLQETFATNVMASFELVKLFLNLPAPTSGGQKTILDVTSAAAQTYIPGAVGYCASKAATIQIMQHFAMAQASNPPHERVRFYSYHPGVVITESYRTYAQASGIDDIEKFKAENGVVHEDIDLPADFAVWLAGPQSDFLHGRYAWAEWDVDELVALEERVEREPGFWTIGLVL